MINWLKKHFIPHDDNDHQPHFLRTKNVQLLILAVFVIQLGVLVLPSVANLTPARSFMALVLPSVLDDLTNQNRQNAHLATLTVNPELNRVAELKAQDMAEKGYFAHVSPEGKTPWYWFNLVGYKYEYAGENLAVDFTDSTDVAIAWMNSPTHKANIVKNAYTEIGTGVATGTYQGNPTIFVAQVFARPKSTDDLISEASVKNVTSSSEALEGKSTSSKVLGASVKNIDAVGTTSVKSAITATPASTSSVSLSTTSAVISSLGSATAKPYKKSDFWTRIISSPRHISNIILIILGLLVILAIGFKLFIRMDKKHPILITNGLIVLILIFTVYVADSCIIRSNTNTNTSFFSFDEVSSK